MQSEMMISEIIPNGKYYTALTDANANQGHRHEFVEIFYVVSGSAIHCVNGKEIPLNAGDLCLLRSSDFHCFAADGNAPFTHRDICVRSDEFKEVCDFIKPDLYENFLAAPSFPSTKIDIDTMNFFESTIKSYVTDINFDCYNQACRIVVSSIVFLLTAHDFASMNFMPDWVRQLADNLRSPYNYQYSVGYLTKDIHFSKQYISNSFKKYMGSSITEYFIKQRLNHAKYLIMTTTDAITNIAYSVGFNNVTFFYRSFKKHFGLTPMELRKKIN